MESDSKVKAARGALHKLRDAVLESDPEYWLCPDCGLISFQKPIDGDCQWCHGNAAEVI